MSEHNPEDSYNNVKKDLKKMAKGFEDTAEGVKEGVEDTAEGVKETASDTTGKDSYAESYDQAENKQYNNARDIDKVQDMAKNAQHNLRQVKESLEQRTSKISDKGNSSEFAKTTGSSTRTILRNPIVILTIIVVIAIFITLLVFNSSNESKNENLSALWNQSLSDLRSGNMTVGEYCLGPVHDEDFCNRLKDLNFMN